MDDRVEIYRAKGLRRRGQWRWRYVNGGNNRKVATGGEGYFNLADLLVSLAAVLGMRRSELSLMSSGDPVEVSVYRKGTYDRLTIVVLP